MTDVMYGNIAGHGQTNYRDCILSGMHIVRCGKQGVRAAARVPIVALM
jgi:hypothetical protein